MATKEDNPLFNNGGKLDATTPREFICPECNSRCTRGTDPDDEYGHREDCPQRPKKYRQKNGDGGSGR